MPEILASIQSDNGREYGKDDPTLEISNKPKRNEQTPGVMNKKLNLTSGANLTRCESKRHPEPWANPAENELSTTSFTWRPIFNARVQPLCSCCARHDIENASATKIEYVGGVVDIPLAMLSMTCVGMSTYCWENAIGFHPRR
ncbi:hypothetical protein I7I51_05227 [Histoplasma capsulatum]|uniref:Uncharacterized protein n=1 Tax=Ajellomyces capsulatus TaxID=5037 RepID=A0A8A1M1U3_AJECA|nr:hypothetical protein I7I51_05227 [Histoplasma capsulatum]